MLAWVESLRKAARQAVSSLEPEEVLQRTYAALGKRFPHVDVRFADDPTLKQRLTSARTEGEQYWLRTCESNVSIVIASDPNPCGSREGYITYWGARVLYTADASWILARGKKTGQYPGDEYNAGLFLSKADVRSVKKRDLSHIVKEHMRGERRRADASGYKDPFEDVAAIAMRNGRICVPCFGIGSDVVASLVAHFPTSVNASLQSEDSYVPGRVPRFFKQLTMRDDVYDTSTVHTLTSVVEMIIKRADT